MPNTILTPNVIANEALMVLKNNLVMANLVHRDYENEFVKVGDTVTARRPSTICSEIGVPEYLASRTVDE